MTNLPDYLCPYAACDGTGWAVDAHTRLAARCQCMEERVRMRNEQIDRRKAGLAVPARGKEEMAW